MTSVMNHRAPGMAREQSSFASRLRRFLAAVEPWYDWGKTATIWRLDQVESDFSDESEGDAYAFEIQWFGLHFGVELGRVPARVSPEQVAINKRRMAAMNADGRGGL